MLGKDGDGHAGRLRHIPEDSLLDLVEFPTIFEGDAHPRGIVSLPRPSDFGMDELILLETCEVIGDGAVVQAQVPLDVRVRVPRVDPNVVQNRPAYLGV